MLAVGQAEAQEAARGETVANRPRPELDPLGIRAGGFLFFPAVAVEQYYDDNLFATETGKVDDFITVVKPSLEITSEWEIHELSVRGEGAIGRYADRLTENYADFEVGADGRLDITRDITASAGGSFERGHEERSSPDDVVGQEPTIRESINGFVVYDHVFGRFNVTADADYRDLNYDDVLAAGGAVINNDDRDREEASAGLRFAYEIVPEYQAFIAGRADTRQYRQERDDNGFLRDSIGWEAIVGVELDFGGIVFGDVFAGYLERDYYDDDTLPNNGGITFGGSVDWNVTPLTTVNGTVVRSIEESSIANASSYFATTGAVTVDHELLRNLLLNARGALTHSDYEFNGGSERIDLTYQADVGATYLVNRYFYATLNYRYTQRASDDNRVGSDPDYRNNVVMIRLEAQM